ncbi:MAG: response regulator [Alphaproteobacteria bacterium]|nr:response regulator [Alphaproteobacteria bacterium]
MLSSSDILMGNILVVDDIPANVQLLTRMLTAAGYLRVSSTMNSQEVCALHSLNRYDLILLDLQMPVMDGFEVIEKLKLVEPGGYLPVLVITAQPSHKLRALQAGAKDFISKPFDLAEVLARVQNMLEVRLLYTELHKFSDELEQRVKDRTSDLRESYLETIFTMTRAAEHKDEDTGAHVQRISYYSRDLAVMLGMDEGFVNNVFFASPMHDVGKIGIPDQILLKPGGHTPAECEIMRTHAAMGAKILGNSKSVYLKMGAEIALNHHERWDGGGYPNRKSGDEIPLAARIVNICDIYDALRSKRSYKPAFDHFKTMEILIRGDGRTQPEHFDPAVFEKFTLNHALFCDIFEKNSGHP